MLLEGSCHCGAVHFRLRSRHPYPFNLCYCSICRKTAGGGGYAINISGDHASLEVTGREQIRIYRAKIRGGDRPRRRKTRRNVISAGSAPAVCGCGTRAGRSWSTLRLGDRHRLADPARAHPPDARLEGVVGPAGDRAA